MMGKAQISLTFSLLGMASLASAITCPGFPGYCSESFPGQTCVVVCSKGRNNVPLCQADGTWTDIPRCVEHEPGVEVQIPGICPGIAGYCSEGFLNARCTFDCPLGKDIDSVCTQDGTWDPYPTCAGDLRETGDGCDPCPGPNGGSRNRTAENLLGTGPSKSRTPKIQDTQDRIVRPTFAGNQVFGTLDTRQKQPAPTPATPTTSRSVFLKQAFTPAPRMRPATTARPMPMRQQPRRQQQQFRPQFQQPQFQSGQSMSRRPSFRQQQRPMMQRPMQQRPMQSQSSNSIFSGGFGRIPSSFSGLPTSVQQQQQQQPRPRTPQQNLQITGSIESVQQQPRTPAPRQKPQQQQQPRRIEATARTPVPPPPQPVRQSPRPQLVPATQPEPRRSGPAPTPVVPSGPVRIFEEDDLSVPTVGGTGNDFFGVFEAVSLGGAPPAPPTGPNLPSFPAIPISDRSSGLPPLPQEPGQFGIFSTVQLKK